MTQHYSDLTRESDPRALPNVEVWEHRHGYVNGVRVKRCDAPHVSPDGDGSNCQDGWYWWPCFPGCLPDGDPIGPFETEAEALADAQDAD